MSNKIEVHEALKPVSWLAGRWTTKDGKGVYPNISDFQYHDELEFSCIGQPMFNYIAKATRPEDQKPLHQERGFLTIKQGTNELALVLSHNFNLTTVEEGTYDPEQKQITLETVNVSRVSFAKPPHVKNFKRVFRLIDENTLQATLWMETEKTPLTEHLKAIYNKSEDVNVM